MALRSNILSIGTEDVAQSKLILEFISSCIAKVDSRSKPLVRDPRSVKATMRADTNLSLVVGRVLEVGTKPKL